MSLIILLFLVGLVFIALEVFVPGAVLGIIGGVSITAGCVLAFLRYGVDGGVIAVIAGLVLAGLLFYVEFAILPKTRFGQRLFLQSAVTATSQPMPADAAVVIGKTAEALTMLAPSGYVAIDGKRYEAFSQDGLVEKGTRLRVTSVDNFTLKVTKL